MAILRQNNANHTGVHQHCPRPNRRPSPHIRPHIRSHSSQPTHDDLANRLFLALLATRDDLEAGSLHDARIGGSAASSRLFVVGAALLRHLVPSTGIAGRVVAGRGAVGRLARLLNDALLRELLAPDELLREMAPVHGLRVGVDRIGDDVCLRWEG